VIVVPLHARGCDQAEVHGGAADACRPEADDHAYLFGGLTLPTPSVPYPSPSCCITRAMSVVDADVGVLTRGAALSLLRTRLAECGANLQRIYHNTRNAPETLINLANDIQTSSLGLKLVEHHAQTATHPGYVLDHFIEQWQSHVANIEQLTNKISQESQKASLSGSLYAAEQQQDLGKLVDRLDHAQNTLQEGVQLYHQEEQNRRWLERQKHSTSSTLRPDHGHNYSGIELREHARAHFGDAYYGDVHITHYGRASPQTVTASKSSTRHSRVLIDNEDRGAQSNQQIDAIQKTMQTHNDYVTSQLSLIVQQTRPQQSLVFEETPPHLIGPERLKRSSELVHERTSIPRRRHTGAVAFRVKFRLPMLFSSRVWEVARIDAHQGWDLCFRTYNRRPRNAKIFEHCEIGDLEEVRLLIQNGEASLLDVDEDGRNLLSVSTTMHNHVGNTNV